jgi:hypothetical protein
MVNRLMALLGLAVVLAAIGAAMLAGAASAVAETGTGSDGDGTKTSESKQETSSKSDPGTSDTASPSAEKPAGEGSDTTDNEKPEASQEETEPPTDQPKVRKATRHEPRNIKPHADERTSGRASAARTEEPAAADAAPTVAKPVSSPHETSTTPAESTIAAIHRLQSPPRRSPKSMRPPPLRCHLARPLPSLNRPPPHADRRSSTPSGRSS